MQGRVWRRLLLQIGALLHGLLHVDARLLHSLLESRLLLGELQLFFFLGAGLHLGGGLLRDHFLLLVGEDFYVLAARLRLLNLLLVED